MEVCVAGYPWLKEHLVPFLAFSLAILGWLADFNASLREKDGVVVVT